MATQEKKDTKPRGILRKDDYLLVDADPIINKIRSAHALAGHPPVKHICQETNLSQGCVRKLLFGNTRKPHHETTALILGLAFGYRESYNPPSRSGLPAFFVEPKKKRGPKPKKAT